MSLDVQANTQTKGIKRGIAKPHPKQYSASNPGNMRHPQHRTNYVNRFWWQPTCGTTGLPLTAEARSARVNKLFAAMTDFSDVYDSNNIFTTGELINNDDIEFTCLRIADAIDSLHRDGLCVPHIADPTMHQLSNRGIKTWRPDEDERNLTPSQREDAIAQHLRHYKKACLDAVQHDKDLVMLFVAAPNVAGKKRDNNARSNQQRKRKFTVPGDEITSPATPKRKVTQSTQMELASPSLGVLSPAPTIMQDFPAEQVIAANRYPGMLNTFDQDSIDPTHRAYATPSSFMLESGFNTPNTDANALHTVDDHYDWVNDPQGLLSGDIFNPILP